MYGIIAMKSPCIMNVCQLKNKIIKLLELMYFYRNKHRLRHHPRPPALEYQMVESSTLHFYMLHRSSNGQPTWAQLLFSTLVFPEGVSCPNPVEQMCTGFRVGQSLILCECYHCLVWTFPILQMMVVAS
jgi:hypothetical protein